MLWHEFGHGAIYSTANWGRFVEIDARSANDETSALHEGVADVIAFMLGNEPEIGRYIGPRSAFANAALRNANNTFKCPDVLWGESHQDSQHFAGAIWQARSTIFQGTDEGHTFDAAFYAALVSFPPNISFEKAAAIISHSVGLAFPSLPLAQGQMKQVFDARGVSSCSKVLDVTDTPAPRKAYIIPGTTFADLAPDSPVPGPYQMKVRVPNGARSLTVSGPYFSGGMTVRVGIVAKANAPITFTRGANRTLLNDADKMVVPTVSAGTMKGTVMIDVPCGGELFFTVTNTSPRDRQLQDLAFSFTPADSCAVVPDAGAPDAGQMTIPDSGVIAVPTGDAGNPGPRAIILDAANDRLGAVAGKTGCGCTGGVGGFFWLVLLAVPLLLRRRRN